MIAPGGLRVRDGDTSAEVQRPECGPEKSKLFLYPNEFMQMVTSRALTHGEGLPKYVAKNGATMQNQSTNWRPQGDSNPCTRDENPVSWAGLDDGDRIFSFGRKRAAT